MTELGWGEFEAGIRIFFKDPDEKVSCTTEYAADLSSVNLLDVSVISSVSHLNFISHCCSVLVSPRAQPVDILHMIRLHPEGASQSVCKKVRGVSWLFICHLPLE